MTLLLGVVERELLHSYFSENCLLAAIGLIDPLAIGAEKVTFEYGMVLQLVAVDW